VLLTHSKPKPTLEQHDHFTSDVHICEKMSMHILGTCPAGEPGVAPVKLGAATYRPCWQFLPRPASSSGCPPNSESELSGGQVDSSY
jgi:hypothetical protein